MPSNANAAWTTASNHSQSPLYDDPVEQWQEVVRTRLAAHNRRYHRDIAETGDAVTLLNALVGNQAALPATKFRDDSQATRDARGLPPKNESAAERCHRELKELSAVNDAIQLALDVVRAKREVLASRGHAAAGLARSPTRTSASPAREDDVPLMFAHQPAAVEPPTPPPAVTAPTTSSPDPHTSTPSANAADDDAADDEPAPLGLRRKSAMSLGKKGGLLRRGEAAPPEKNVPAAPLKPTVSATPPAPPSSQCPTLLKPWLPSAHDGTKATAARVVDELLRVMAERDAAERAEIDVFARTVPIVELSKRVRGLVDENVELERQCVQLESAATDLGRAQNELTDALEFPAETLDVAATLLDAALRGTAVGDAAAPSATVDDTAVRQWCDGYVLTLPAERLLLPERAEDWAAWADDYDRIGSRFGAALHGAASGGSTMAGRAPTDRTQSLAARTAGDGTLLTSVPRPVEEELVQRRDFVAWFQASTGAFNQALYGVVNPMVQRLAA